MTSCARWDNLRRRRDRITCAEDTHLIADLGDLAQRFEFDSSDFSYDPGYNVAPTESVLTVRNVEGREAAFMRWGLVPFWVKDPKIGSRMINARAETVAEKPAFSNALKKRRCLVLADGYYEWQKTPAGKRPYRIILKSGEPFAMAGLWETWRDPQGNVVPSCTIITTAANDFLAVRYTTGCPSSCPGSRRSCGWSPAWKMPLPLPGSSHPIRTSVWTRMRCRRL